jgi:hypothetical protein
MQLFALSLATIVPVVKALKVLWFGWVYFVGKLTK